MNTGTIKEKEVTNKEKGTPAGTTSSRDRILGAVKASQPPLVPLPAPIVPSAELGDVQRFKTVLETIGGTGTVHLVPGIEEVLAGVEKLFPGAKRVVSAVTSIERHYVADYSNVKHHSLHDVDVVILGAQFGVAENGAVWVTEKDTKIRVLPFIGEHLVVLLDARKIVPTMHHAYEIIGQADYGFGAFIAGPSKTADIEQSLVLGAHGPKSMNVFVLTGK
ncbi:LUD domain-containing protein [Paraflavisolibacter sp. H34]|uniref:LutC/YkgG family protein n=1 Tax=Huijunlia imazamoxiresistens TaxID=3127457 RepID=UPI0030168537